MTRTTRRRRVLRVLAAGAILVVSSFPLSASASPAAGHRAGASPVTKSKTVKRTYIDDGKTTVVDKRKVTLTVDQTTNLRSLQLIHVSWSGAHPTGGVVPDQNSDLAQNEEYSFALFECRGTDTADHPLSPNTCWTQYADERFVYGYTSWPAWRSDSAATPGQRRAIVGAPDQASQPLECRVTLAGTSYQRWVPFAGTGRDHYAGGPFGCAGAAPEASPANYSSLALPSNETFGVTGTDGKGETNFDVFTAEDHESLGCSATVACSLVAVPIEGISCDPAGTELPPARQLSGAALATATANCESTGNYQPGQPLPVQGSGDPAVDGTLWWSPSNWANRITVPLHFAPADNVCSLNSSAAPVDVYGSELMIQATTQWAPHFCLNPKLFDLGHVQTPEPEARSLLATGNIEAAYTSDAPDDPYPTPTVSAPVAVTGFGIAYDVDGNDQEPVPGLRLDARLIAKLLTESYPDQPFVRDSYTALAHNPLNITQDPEFRALNPHVPQADLDGASTLLTLNTDSDVVEALTAYINADPEARAWLDGKPDPWGMVVNPNYKGISLPVDNWPLLDSFEPLDEYQPGKNDCLYADPVPYLPLVAAPTARLFSIGQDMQFAISQSQTVCVLPSPIPGSLAGAKLVAQGRQATGHRAMFGTVSLGDAAREGLSLAALQTSSSVPAGKQFTNASGRTFAGPTTAGLRAAADTLAPDKHTGTWPVSYAKLRQSDAAYPGTMVVYAAVPTSGLAPSDAKDYSELLSFAASEGQHQGTSQGDLPPGYLPMTAGNGLGALAGYTARAAHAVTAQKGAQPALVPGKKRPPPSSTPPASSNPKPHRSHTHTRSTGAPANPGNRGHVAPTPTTSATHRSKPTGSPSASASQPPPTTNLTDASQVAATTPQLDSPVSGLVLPGLLGLAFAAGIVAAAVRVWPRGRRAR